jgi:RND superfamily putative drug exporter
MESRIGADEVDRAFGQNQITPIRLVMQAKSPNGALTPEFLTALRHLTNVVAADPRAQQVASLSTLLGDVPDAQYRLVNRDSFSPTPKVSPDQPPAMPAVPTQIAGQFVNLNGAADTATVLIVPKAGMYERGHLGFVTDIRDRIIPEQSDLRSYQVLVGGDAASFVDFKGALYGRFPVVALVISIAILVLLMLFFRSILIPVKAAITSAIPLVATYGVLVWLFQDGHGEKLLGFTSQGRLNVVTPLIVFVILFALSTDYEVFLLSRVRENYERTGNTARSVAAGMQQTASLIMAAAVILIATFGSLAASSVETLKEIGIGLAVGILLDATIVRLILVPATMQLARGGNWWLPGWLERILPRVNHGADTASVPAEGGVDTGPVGTVSAASERAPA